MYSAISHGRTQRKQRGAPCAAAFRWRQRLSVTTRAETGPRGNPACRVVADSASRINQRSTPVRSPVTPATPRRISGSGGPGHERTCSEPFLTVRGETADARSEPSGARFPPRKSVGRPHLLGAFWPNPATPRGLPSHPRTQLGHSAFIHKKRYRTHSPGEPESFPPGNPAANPPPRTGPELFRDPLFAPPSSQPGRNTPLPTVACVNPARGADGPPRAAFTAAGVPGKAAPLPRAQDLRTYSPSPPPGETGR